jgi:ribosomal protein S18 acetylase RimI-like enzyme
MAAPPASTEQKGVIIRPMKKEDEATVAELWLEGLSQTSEASSVLVRSFVASKMKGYGEYATSQEGDVGPNGCKLMDSWGVKDDRIMLVACLEEEPEKVVGSVGVKKGLAHDVQEPDSSQASIWRMSVSPPVRRRGLGKKLMQAAEEHAKNEYKCTAMGLMTANEIAGKFYSEKCGYQVVEGQTHWYDPISPFPKILRYEKDLV